VRLALLFTFGTPTTFRLDVFIEILLAVIIGDLLAEHNIAFCFDPHMAFGCIGLGIGPAGMIDIASSVPPWCAVDVDMFVDIENIQAGCFVVGGIRQHASDIFDNLLPLGNRFHGKKAEAV